MKVRSRPHDLVDPREKRRRRASRHVRHPIKHTPQRLMNEKEPVTTRNRTSLNANSEKMEGIQDQINLNPLELGDSSRLKFPITTTSDQGNLLHVHNNDSPIIASEDTKSDPDVGILVGDVARSLQQEELTCSISDIPTSGGENVCQGAACYNGVCAEFDYMEDYASHKKLDQFEACYRLYRENNDASSIRLLEDTTVCFSENYNTKACSISLDGIECNSCTVNVQGCWQFDCSNTLIGTSGDRCNDPVHPLFSHWSTDIVLTDEDYYCGHNGALDCDCSNLSTNDGSGEALCTRKLLSEPGSSFCSLDGELCLQELYRLSFQESQLDALEECVEVATREGTTYSVCYSHGLESSASCSIEINGSSCQSCELEVDENGYMVEKFDCTNFPQGFSNLGSSFQDIRPFEALNEIFSPSLIYPLTYFDNDYLCNAFSEHSSWSCDCSNQDLNLSCQKSSSNRGHTVTADYTTEFLVEPSGEVEASSWCYNLSEPSDYSICYERSETRDDDGCTIVINGVACSSCQRRDIVVEEDGNNSLSSSSQPCIKFDCRNIPKGLAGTRCSRERIENNDLLHFTLNQIQERPITLSPTETPSYAPTDMPSYSPTDTPTASASAPTAVETPDDIPTEAPLTFPASTKSPTAAPVEDIPTEDPSTVPASTKSPTTAPVEETSTHLGTKRSFPEKSRTPSSSKTSDDSEAPMNLPVILGVVISALLVVVVAVLIVRRRRRNKEGLSGPTKLKREDTLGTTDMRHENSSPSLAAAFSSSSLNDFDPKPEGALTKATMTAPTATTPTPTQKETPTHKNVTLEALRDNDWCTSMLSASSWCSEDENIVFSA